MHEYGVYILNLLLQSAQACWFAPRIMFGKKNNGIIQTQYCICIYGLNLSHSFKQWQFYVHSQLGFQEKEQEFQDLFKAFFINDIYKKKI